MTGEVLLLLLLLLLWNVSLLRNVGLLLWHLLLLLLAVLLLLHVLLLLGAQFSCAVRKGAAVTPGARSALPVHANLRLALGAVDADAATAASHLAVAAAAAHLAVPWDGLHDAHLWRMPVGRLRGVVNIVDLAFGCVRLLPPWGQLNSRLCGEVSSLHIVLLDLFLGNYPLTFPLRLRLTLFFEEKEGVKSF